MHSKTHEVVLLGGSKEPEALVFGAELRCQYGSIRNYLLTEDFASKGINGLPAKFVVTDCVQGINIMPFGDCYGGGSCISQWMLDDKWENPDGQNETLGGKEIITTASHLVCNTWGVFILPVNSGQNTDIGKQLMLLAELDGELLDFIMNPYNSIYTPVDISQKVLGMLDQIINSDLYGGSIFLMAQGGHDIMGPIILASIGHLVPSIGVGDSVSLLNGMENMITRTGIRTDADPRNLDAEILRILKADSEWYAGEVTNAGFYKWQEEHKMLAAFLADAVNSAAYATIAYASMDAYQRQSSQQSSYNQDYNDALIGQSNRGEGVNYKGETVRIDAAGRWRLPNGRYADVYEPYTPPAPSWRANISGGYSINYDGYPQGVPKPPTNNVRLVEGAEYEAARTTADKANAAIHKANPALSGMEIHEIQPVKFGGSPTDPANKIPLTPAQHSEVTVWWNRLQNSMLQ